jgi:hypothetical protein
MFLYVQTQTTHQFFIFFQFAVEQAKKARIQRDYDAVESLITEALYHFKVLSGITAVFRETNPTEAALKVKDQRKYLQIKDPKKYVTKLAVLDGQAARASAVAFLDEKVSERSERALRKTSILAMNPAKWLQT